MEIGNIAQWVSVTISCIGAVAIIYTRKTLKNTLSNQEKEQAKQISAWLVKYKNNDGLLIANYSNALVYDLDLSISYYKSFVDKSYIEIKPQHKITIVPPGFLLLTIEYNQQDHINQFVKYPDSVDIKECIPLSVAKNINVNNIFFTDATGLKWQREKSGKLIKI